VQPKIADAKKGGARRPWRGGGDARRPAKANLSLGLRRGMAGSVEPAARGQSTGRSPGGQRQGRSETQPSWPPPADRALAGYKPLKPAPAAAADLTAGNVHRRLAGPMALYRQCSVSGASKRPGKPMALKADPHGQNAAGQGLRFCQCRRQRAKPGPRARRGGRRRGRARRRRLPAWRIRGAARPPRRRCRQDRPRR
jgi:hypothetical protein